MGACAAVEPCGVFSIGYVAMARQITNAGAFYTYVARGLGRIPGVSAAFVAVLAYNALQIALYGGFGVLAQGLALEKFGWDAAWWVWALGAWVIVAILGLLRVDLNGKVLAVLLIAEIVILLIYDFFNLANPAGGTIDFSPLNPSGLFTAGIGAALILAMTGFVGFESAAIFSEEAKNPRRTVPVATFLTLVIIASFTRCRPGRCRWPPASTRSSLSRPSRASSRSWALPRRTSTRRSPTSAPTCSSRACSPACWRSTTRSPLPVRAGPGERAAEGARPDQPALGCPAHRVGRAECPRADRHRHVRHPQHRPARQAVLLGRHARRVRRAAARHGHSVAVIAYFAKTPGDENVITRFLAPAVSAILLGIMSVVAFINFDTLLGVPPTDNARYILPALYLLAISSGSSGRDAAGHQPARVPVDRSRRQRGDRSVVSDADLNPPTSAPTGAGW